MELENLYIDGLKFAWVCLGLFHPEINGVVRAPTEITGFAGPILEFTN